MLCEKSNGYCQNLGFIFEIRVTKWHTSKRVHFTLSYMLFIKHGECSSSDWYWSSFGWQFGRRTETIRWTYIHIHIYHSLRYWGSLHMMLLSFSSKIGVSFSKLACIFNICSSMVRNCHILEEPFNLYIQIWSSSIFNQSILESKYFLPWLHPCIFNLH